MMDEARLKWFESIIEASGELHPAQEEELIAALRGAWRERDDERAWKMRAERMLDETLAGKTAAYFKNELELVRERADRAEAEVKRLYQEDDLRTKEHNLLVRENRLLRTAAERVYNSKWDHPDPFAFEELGKALSASLRLTDEIQR